MKTKRSILSALALITLALVPQLPAQTAPAAICHWAYEASIDAAGKTGNREQLGTAASLRAKLHNEHDALEFSAAYDRQVSDRAKSADELRLGVDYANRFTPRMSWYARDEVGFDRVEDIEFYNVAAVGLGYDVLRDPLHLLTARVGVGYRHESYGNPATADLRSAAADVALRHSFEFWSAKLVNTASWTPVFKKFSNYRLTHESYCELPMAHPAWKLRLGVANDYHSQPARGVERLDTSYFTRFVLNWR